MIKAIDGGVDWTIANATVDIFEKASSFERIKFFSFFYFFSHKQKLKTRKGLFIVRVRVG